MPSGVEQQTVEPGAVEWRQRIYPQTDWVAKTRGMSLEVHIPTLNTNQWSYFCTYISNRKKV